MQFSVKRHSLSITYRLYNSPVQQNLRSSKLINVRGKSNLSNRKRAKNTKDLVSWAAFGVAATSSTALVVIYWFSDDINQQIPLQPSKFTPFTLTSKEFISPTCRIFTLKPISSKNNSSIYEDAWKKGVWSIQVKQPQLQIARSYTPLPPAQGEQNTSNLRLLIRREPQGEVSSYLHNLPLGATIELRGPNVDYEVSEDVGEILFLAGGTGIVPALQVAYHLFEYRKSNDLIPKMRILWANRRRQDALGATSDTARLRNDSSMDWNKMFSIAGTPIQNQAPPELVPSSVVKELQTLKDKMKGNMTVDYFFDEESTYITERILLNHFSSADKPGSQFTLDSSPQKRLLLISGPEGFTRHYSGPKVWVGGQELQGSLGGILKKINPRAWEVWKL